MRLPPITLDFETYYDKDYSLRKMKTVLYVRDPRFKVHGVGIKIGDKPTKYYRCKSEIKRIFHQINWSNYEVVGHNLNFDGLILTHHYGVHPTRWFDTKAVANVVLPNNERKTLENTAKILNIPINKISGLEQSKGCKTLTKEQHDILETYCIRDVDVTYQIYQLLKDVLPDRERYLSSITTRMAADPVLVLNQQRLEQEVQRLEDQRATILRSCPISKTVLSSNPKFVKWMESQGIDVPYKDSTKKDKTTGKRIPTRVPALSKDDLGFRELQADYPQHKAVWEARLSVKSTIEITRAKAFLEISKSGPMPMPLNYYGAHTGRWSGADGLNVQNLPRGGELRQSIYAPPGYVVVVLDSSQIELRVSADFCGQHDVLNVLRNGDDAYLHAATNHFGYPCTDKRLHYSERMFGKMLTLALGYGMGWRKLRVNAALGFMGTPPVQLSKIEAQQAVIKWRANNYAIKNMWDKLNSLIPAIASDEITEFNGLKFGNNRIELPNGMALTYYDLRYDPKEEQWVYEGGKKLYGGILLENIIQALARIIIAEQMERIDKREIRVVSSTHDEIIAICRKDKADQVEQIMYEEMTAPVLWAPNLPLDAEGGYAENYSK